jgi:D-tyrosyl-tRNA(Tyr) deacylase
MRALVQRVSEARVAVGGEIVGEIGGGLCVLVGISHTDDPDIATRLARKVATLRVFEDGSGVMNHSLLDTGGAALVISQFTLYGDTRKGRRPSWSEAAPGPVAEPLVRAFAEQLAADGLTVETGRFGAEMSVALVNEGPVTLILELDRGDATSEG